MDPHSVFAPLVVLASSAIGAFAIAVGLDVVAGVLVAVKRKVFDWNKLPGFLSSQFGTVEEGVIVRHLTFVPLGGIKVDPDGLQVAVSREQVQGAPNIEQHSEGLSQADESALYHHYELNYTPPNTESGRRLARR